MKTFLLALLVCGTLTGNSHDITTLPAWGPYSKQYAGISRISDIDSGLRVDFSLMPGMYRRNVCVPNLLFESGCHPWYVSPDMKTITYRHEIEWKDRVYVDAIYHVLDEGRVLLEMHCVNNTDAPQDLTLHTVASLACAEQYPAVTTTCRFIPGIRYSSYEPAVKKYNYSLVYDGWFRGEVRDARTLTGSAICTSGDSGDQLTYDLGSYSGPVAIRCKAEMPMRFALNGREFSLESPDYSILSLGELSGKIDIETISNGKLTVDAILLGENAGVIDTPLDRVPTLETTRNSFILKYKADPMYYGVAWNYPLSDVNQYVNSDLDIIIRRTVHQHTSNRFEGDLKGHYTSAFQRPVCIKAGADTTLYNLLVSGDHDFVAEELEAFRKDEGQFTSLVGEHSPLAEKLLPGAEKYEQGRRLLQATILTNIVYPVYTQGQYIRHFTPGKNWNSLYTWDSGFISWALSDIDPVKSFETLRAYTTEEGSQSAFIHHGTPLPIQFFALSNLLERNWDKGQLEFLYPRLKRFYSFMCGHDASSSTMMDSGLIRTWDYFYNSGGWDDYPPQHYLKLHPEGYPDVAPVVSTAYYIRAAKIMRQCARILSLKDDIKMYDKDIRKMSEAILNNAWDEDSGYFGYVDHDRSGKPEGILRHQPDSVNFNMGIDGISPLVAGICDERIQETLTKHIFNPDQLWTDVGISTVDQSAPYFTISGYWNGCVWMPHQLVLWKSMLDMARPDLAEKIAMTALDSWASEISQTYQCYEHFMIESGRGKGWHNFSGLSAPIINWFTSYYKIGTVSTGFDILVSEARFNENCSGFNASLVFDSDAAGKTGSLVLCLNPDFDYVADMDGKQLKTKSPRPGLLYIDIPEKKTNSKLTVKPR